MRYDTRRAEILIHPDILKPAVQVLEHVCIEGVGLLKKHPADNYFNLVKGFSKLVRTLSAMRFESREGEGSYKVHFYKCHRASHTLLETEKVDFRFSVVSL